ncbi:hypothetical protein FRC08_016558, partial [Ceratobasidium sp. 394]
MAKRVTSDSESEESRSPPSSHAASKPKTAAKRARTSVSTEAAPAKRPKNGKSAKASNGSDEPNVAKAAKQLASAAVPLPGA